MIAPGQVELGERETALKLRWTIHNLSTFMTGENGITPVPDAYLQGVAYL